MFQFTLDQIQCFQAVIEEGSFSKASEKLFKAKSAVIYSVNKLEEQLGFKLLKRDSYRSELTAQGEDFYQRCLGLINEYERLRTYSSMISEQVETTLGMSVSGIYGMKTLYQVIRKAMQTYPHTDIRLEREILSGEKMLHSSQVDLAVCEHIIDFSTLETKQIGQVTLKLVLAADHPFLRLPKAQQNRENLKKWAQIIQRSTIQDGSLSFGVFEDTPKWKVTDILSKKEVICEGFGWGKLPDFLVNEEIESGQLVHLKQVEPEEVLPVYLARRKGGAIGKVANFIWNSL